MERLRLLALPTGVYLAVTVFAPGINGGFLRAPFWAHALWVLAGCAAVVLALTVFRWLTGRAASAPRRRGDMVRR